MALEFSQHRNIVQHLHHMLKRLKENACSSEQKAQADWCLQKIDELRDMQGEVQRAAQRLHELRLHLHAESHRVYIKLKAENRVLNKAERKSKAAVNTLY